MRTFLKWALPVLLLALLLTFAACNKTPPTGEDTTADTVQTTAGDVTEEPTEAPTEEGSGEVTETPTEEPTEIPTEEPTEPAETEPSFSDKDVVKAQRDQLSFKASEVTVTPNSGTAKVLVPRSGLHRRGLQRDQEQQAGLQERPVPDL